MNLADHSNIHALMADAMVGNARGAAVKCATCGKNFDSTMAALTDYLKSGWPICCGQTATLALLK